MATTKRKQTTYTQRVGVVEDIIRTWATRQYIDKGGDKGTFSTRAELKAIHSDPIGWLSLLGGEDAAEVLRMYIRRAARYSR